MANNKHVVGLVLTDIVSPSTDSVIHEAWEAKISCLRFAIPISLFILKIRFFTLVSAIFGCIVLQSQGASPQKKQCYI